MLGSLAHTPAFPVALFSDEEHVGRGDNGLLKDIDIGNIFVFFFAMQGVIRSFYVNVFVEISVFLLG